MLELSRSSENYLKTIYQITLQGEIVRSSTIAEWMGVSRPSVSKAIHKLEQEKFIAIDAKKEILLTTQGIEVSKAIYERYLFLVRVLMELGVDEETARRDACGIEHDISLESLHILENHIMENTC